MSTPLKNKLLRGSEEAMEGALTPKNRENYTRIVVMGLRTGLKDGLNGPLASLKDSKDVVKDCALAAVNLVQLMRIESQGTMPIQAMAPAAYTLMLRALDFAEQAKLIDEVDLDVLTQATHIYTNQIFKVLGVTPQMLSQAATGVHGVAESPSHMEMVRRVAGVVKDPRASSPVDVGPPPPRNRAERRAQMRRG